MKGEAVKGLRADQVDAFAFAPDVAPAGVDVRANIRDYPFRACASPMSVSAEDTGGRRRREYSAESVRNPPSSLIARSPYLGFNEATRGIPRKTTYIRVLPPPGWQRRAMRKHSDPPLSCSARQTLESPV